MPRRTGAWIALLLSTLLGSRAHAADAPVVTTTSGPVRGALGDGIRRFLGIPYAAPPVGDARWRPPQPPAPWTTPRDATAPGASCPQVLPIVNVQVGAEDCLYLNVFTPDPAPRKAPVMVWIHGGGFTVGAATDDDPSRLVARTGVIVVAINYRLGPLGFLAHPALTAEHPTHASGNLGLEDQQAALRWVRDNVAAFGGDPKAVTIFGESAGSMSVCMQMASPGARGLFRRAIGQSGACALPMPTAAAAEAQGARFAQVLGCDGAPDVLACLRGASADAVLAALPPDPTFLFDRSVNWLPTMDGVVLPADLPGAFARGRFNRVPMILGENRDEGRLFAAMAFNAQGTQITAGSWADVVDGYFGPTVGPLVRARYPLADYPDPGAAFGQAIGDVTLACPVVRFAETIAKHVPVYVYEFVHEPNPFVLPTPGITLGAFHSAELPYVFAGPVQSSGPFTFTPDEARMVEQVTTAWTRFARRGRPGGGWPRFARKGGRYLELDPSPRVLRHPKADVCRFWDDTGWSLAAQ